MAMQLYQARGGRVSASPLYDLGGIFQSGAVNSSLKNTLHFAGIPGTASRSYFVPYGASPRSGVQRTGIQNLAEDIIRSGFGLTNKGLGQADVQRELTRSLQDRGVADLDEIGYVLGIDRTPTFFNRATGERIADAGERFGKTKLGKGSQDFYLALDSQGRVVPYNQWDPEQKDYSGLGMLLTFVSAVLAPYATGWISGATGLGAAGAGALYGAGTGALTSAATGGNVGKGLLTGAIGGGLAGALGAGTGQLNLAGTLGITNPTTQAIINKAIAGGLTGAVSAGVNKGDIGRGLLGGAIGGAIGGATKGGPLASAVTRPVTNQLVEQIVGSPYQKQIDKQIQEMQRLATTQQQELARMQARPDPALDIGQMGSGVNVDELTKLMTGGGTGARVST